MPINIDCFKAYDIRGQIPNQLNADIAYRIGNATVEFLGAKTMVLGRDIRLSSAEFADAVAAGMQEAGANVIDIGLGGTEMVYFATGDLKADGGIMVTASHNPADYNGLKIVREGARPISGDTGLQDIRKLAEQDERLTAATSGNREGVDITKAYIDRLLSFIDPLTLLGLRIVANAGNGGAGLTLDALAPQLPFDFIKVHHKPDGTFPNGVPNPMLEENRASTVDAIRDSEASFGIAWDGDFDRCFFFDENGRFIEGYYIVGLLAQAQLEANPGAGIVYDPRLTWNTIEIAKEFNGRAIQSKSGHSFMKDVMRQEDAVYGGEMSAHHYFRNFFYCDSGMIPWLLVAELVSTSGKSLSQLVDARMARYPASGEINRTVPDAGRAIKAIRDHYAVVAKNIDETDGVSLEFKRWRFNLRASNTEPVIRLNVETRGDQKLLDMKVPEILALLDGTQ
jgi:phosphomannomutase